MSTLYWVGKMLYSSWPAVSTTNTSYYWPCTFIVLLIVFSMVGSYESTNWPWTNWMTRLDLPTDREPITAIFLCFKGIFAPSGYWCICKGLHINSDLSDCNYHTMYTSLCSSVSLLDIVFLIYIFCLTTICRRSVFGKQFFKLCFHILARPRARLQLE